MTCLVDAKAKDQKSVEDQRVKENMELHKEVKRLRGKINRLSGLHQETKRLRAEKTQEASNLAEERNKLFNEVEELKKEVTRRGEGLIKATYSFKQNVVKSYLVGSEAALEQAVIIHPTMDL